MTLLTVPALKLHLGNTTTDDAALARLLDAAEASIDARIGPLGTVTETHRASGPLLPLTRRAEAVLSVVEHGITLAPNDYALRPSGGIVERLSSGTHPSHRWRGSVNITIATADDTPERIRVQIGLVKLDLGFTPGTGSERIGDWSETSSQQQGITYAQLREEYLASLEPAGWLV
jgi:hypothetical protein